MIFTTENDHINIHTNIHTDLESEVTGFSLNSGGANMEQLLFIDTLDSGDSDLCFFPFLKLSTHK